MRNVVCIIIGIIVGITVNLYGEWKQAIPWLMVCMTSEYLTSVLVGIFEDNKNNTDGILGFKGIAEKLVMLFIVIVAQRIDILLNTNFIGYAVAAGFMAREVFSVIEKIKFLCSAKS